MKGILVGLVTNCRWPLHPRPSEWEDLETWVRRIAEAYGVSYDAFLLNALSWLRVSGTTEMPQVDERVCHQLHAIVMLLDKLEPQQQPFEFILPREGPLHA